MALVTSAGTETLHSAHFQYVTDTETTLILGEAHHIYTVLSIIVFGNDIGNAAPQRLKLSILGYDSTGSGDSAEYIHIAGAIMDTNATWVWNDKFSFNGDEPSSNTQAARAAQASGTAQKLVAQSTTSSNKYDITITFIDQNNE